MDYQAYMCTLLHEVFSYLRQNTYIFPLFLFKATDPDVGNVRRSILHLDLHMHVTTRSVISRHVFLSGLECLYIALNIADYSSWPFFKWVKCLDKRFVAIQASITLQCQLPHALEGVCIAVQLCALSQCHWHHKQLSVKLTQADSIGGEIGGQGVTAL